MKKHVGILSIYYKNYNYGGQLQAYALWKTIKKLGYNCEQITFARNKSFAIRKIYVFYKQPFSKKIDLLGIYINRFKYRFLKLFNKADNNINNIKKFDIFMNSIEHTKKCSSANIASITEKFDCLVCGSDQVWNTDLCPYEYFFNFLNDKIPRISYAASIRKSNFDWFEKDKIQKLLNKFSYITVRENEGKKIVEEIVDKEVRVVLDPVFLITREEWLKVASKDDYNEEYILVYLIQNYGNDRKNIVREYARKFGLKAYLISNPGYAWGKEDLKFDKITTGVGPAEFITLIANAKYVVTDSFHCTAFSIIFNKRFFVFGKNESGKRNKGPIIDDRKQTILSHFGLEKCSISETEFMNEEKLNQYIDYEFVNHKLNSMRKDSKDYLNMMLNSVK